MYLVDGEQPMLYYLHIAGTCMDFNCQICLTVLRCSVRLYVKVTPYIEKCGHTNTLLYFFGGG